uniref:Uncharacterized protein n=1 Tax=Nelumbo nucifera TaxID=4432 RepID=A0A822Z1W7_NELNU|nr:TPA_asm: hypothetical protein HUJ06_013325 [Nelumbo nucifera]
MLNVRPPPNLVEDGDAADDQCSSFLLPPLYVEGREKMNSVFLFGGSEKKKEKEKKKKKTEREGARKGRRWREISAAPLLCVEGRE